jgi:hypothetical protein
MGKGLTSNARIGRPFRTKGEKLVMSHLLFNRIVYRQYHMGNCCNFPRRNTNPIGMPVRLARRAHGMARIESFNTLIFNIYFFDTTTNFINILKTIGLSSATYMNPPGASSAVRPAPLQYTAESFDFCEQCDEPRGNFSER